MEPFTRYIIPEIKLSCNYTKLIRTEVLFEHHVLVWLISGETKIIQAGASYVFHSKDIFLIPRNRVTTVINTPKSGLPHKAVAMLLSVDRLRADFSTIEIRSHKSTINKVVHFKKHPLLESCICSLEPYFEIQEEFPEHIALLKIAEALTLIRMLDHDVDPILSNFETPGKTDLVTFMKSHFMFNISLEKFGYLSGRSLSTFNRDFRKTFNETPQKWLTQQRLLLAHQQLTTRKPNDIYQEVGFEDLSHFSFAFKKQFGFSPTAFTKTTPFAKS